MTTVKRRPRAATKPKLDVPKLVQTFAEFRRLKVAESTAKSQHEKLRDSELMPALEAYGRAHGETGAHLAIDLPEPVDGFVRLVRRANVSRLFDIEAAEKLAADKGVLDEVQQTTFTLTVRAEDAAAVRKAITALQSGSKVGDLELAERTELVQDALYALHQRDRDLITEAELDALIVEDVKYAFFPEK